MAGKDYRAITGDVAEVRVALGQGKSINDKATYGNTRFKTESDPWPAFASRVLFDKSNGVASRGQSVLSRDNRERFLGEQGFVDAFIELIKEPNKVNFAAFGIAWGLVADKYSANRNTLLVNRALAACTLNVTCAVNGSNFETVYQWLVGEDILTALTDQAADWYDKNVHLMSSLRQVFADGVGQEKQMPCAELLSIFVWCLFENISNPFSLKKQVIKYGAPGTGKTYAAKRDTRLLFDIWREDFGQDTPFTHESHCEVVQFHPSFGYEDFMEGLRPILDDDGKAQLTLQNGIFKQLCLRAAIWERDVHSIPVQGPDLAKKWDNLRIKDLIPYQVHLAEPHWRHIFGQSAKTRKLQRPYHRFSSSSTRLIGRSFPVC